MKQSALTTLVIGALVALGGCSAKTPEGATTNDPSTGSVVRSQVPAATPSAPAPAPASAALRNGQGPKGNTVSLDSVAVHGDILTVSMTFSGGDCCVHLPLDQVSVIDDATAQRLSILTDNAGKPMAAPLEANTSVTPTDFRHPAVVWFKFPAPSAGAKTVSINMPGVTPFDAVPVAR